MRSSHPFYMYDQGIQAQPDSVRRVFREETEKIKNMVTQVTDAGVERIHLVGMGTSYHAALVAQQWIQNISQMSNVLSWQSFEFVLNDVSPINTRTLNNKDLVIVLSHRGTKQYSSMALNYAAKETEAITVLLTSIASPADVENVDHVIHTSLPEKSSAFTVSHTCALAALMTFAVELGLRKQTAIAQELHDKQYQELVVQLLKHALSLENNIRTWIKDDLSVQLSPIKQCKLFFVANGANTSTAYEVALKIKETSYINVEGFQLEQYLHGPFCATDADTSLVTFLLSPPTPTSHISQIRYQRARQLIEAALAVKARVALITQESDPINHEVSDARVQLLILPDMPELLTPIIYLIPLQLFTYWLCLDHPDIAGTVNPDVFRMDDPLHANAKTKYTTF